ncbi:hypothetical protein PIIN_09170 [Serendipita indica DSM 11827]|uniref:Uncharacterized protein n=1 Tax=Serendipita indica (strain DSM 11827) TaxID=1109443 RepID=G4TV43_SERID|nr:hypothetical protein PIIN_09170 [Serendipita indica DSM 11827]
MWGSRPLTVLLLTCIELAVMSTLASRWILSPRQLTRSLREADLDAEARKDATSELPITTFGHYQSNIGDFDYSGRTWRVRHIRQAHRAGPRTVPPIDEHVIALPSNRLYFHEC